MQFLGPSPKGNQLMGCLLLTASSVNLSGSKTSGSGYILGSRWMESTGTSIRIPSGIVSFVPENVYGLRDLLLNEVAGGYFLRVSGIKNDSHIIYRLAERRVKVNERKMYHGWTFENLVKVLHGFDEFVSQLTVVFRYRAWHFIPQFILNPLVLSKLVEAVAHGSRCSLIASEEKYIHLSRQQFVR